MNLTEERDVENIYKMIMRFNRNKTLSNNSLFDIIEKNKSDDSNYNIVLLYIIKKLSYNDWEILNCNFFKIKRIVY